jgi:hypothetical protein
MLAKMLASAIGAAALVVVIAMPAAAGGTAAQKCAQTKIKVAGKAAACLLGLQSKDAAKGGGVDPAKETGCHTKLSDAFSKADAGGGCGATGDASTVDAAVTALVNSVVADLKIGTPNKCQGAKIKSAGKKSKCLLGVEAKEAGSGVAKDPAKAQKCRDKFSAAFAKNEAKGGCATNNDAGGVETKVDENADDMTLTLTCPDSGDPEFACDCGSPAPTKFGFTVRADLAGTNCGLLRDDTGNAITGGDLICNGLYIGGGQPTAPVPDNVPDYGASLFNVGCCARKKMRLAATTSIDTGSNRNCTKAGCLYGAPLPVVNAGLSTCVINTIASDGTGIATCDVGSNSQNLPLTSNVTITGDELPRRCDAASGTAQGRKCTSTGGVGTDTVCGPSGTCLADPAVQPCPICNTTTNLCNGGTNDGNACSATTELTAPQYPTSHDCPHSAGIPLGNLPVPYALTTGTQSKLAFDIVQTNIFCGFCANSSAPSGSANFENPAHPCTKDADCTNGSFTFCRQLHSGAFGFPGSMHAELARRITETGASAGAISSTSGPKDGTLVSVFCIPPTFNGLVDGAASLPGPGAAALKGKAELLP